MLKFFRKPIFSLLGVGLVLLVSCQTPQSNESVDTISTREYVKQSLLQSINGIDNNGELDGYGFSNKENSLDNEHVQAAIQMFEKGDIESASVFLLSKAENEEDENLSHELETIALVFSVINEIKEDSNADRLCINRTWACARSAAALGLSFAGLFGPGTQAIAIPSYILSSVSFVADCICSAEE